METQLKTCTKCYLEKDIDQYQFRNGKPIARCKKCITEDIQKT